MKMILGLLTTVLLVAVSRPVQTDESLELVNFGPGKLAAFTVRSDGRTEVRFRINGTWEDGWTNLGGIITSEVAAVSWSAGRIDLFGRGGDNALWHCWFDEGSWHAWELLGEVIGQEKPAVISRAYGKLEIFVLGIIDRSIWVREYGERSGWVDWRFLGGVCTTCTSGVAAISSGDQRADVFCIGADNKLWTRSSASASADFGEWRRLGDELLKHEITVTSRSAGTIDVFARNKNKNLVQIGYASGDWGAWGNLEGGLNAGPVAVSAKGNTMVVFVKGDDGAIWERTWLGDDWSCWKRISGPGTAKPVAVTSDHGVVVGYANSCSVSLFDFTVVWTDI